MYLDETTFNAWQNPRKLWIKSNQKNMKMQSHRGKSITLIGCIDNIVGMRYFELFTGSNNSKTFMLYIKNLIKHIGTPSLIVLDNLPVHKSKSVTELISKHKILKLLFLPPYSSSLNPIEYLWNVIKREWRKFLVSKNNVELD